ncbi:MAG: outer membrane lipid asymmetry maintenance protein MlaD [Legionellales bacterium]|nr:outer membrane lipid asymmetry maintenance protein MlaD [Legionellales bacterium]
MRKAMVELTVGLFMLLAILALLFLAFRVSGISHIWHGKTYTISADFQNVGDLKENAAVTLAGVKIGQVEKIQLNSQTLDANVTMVIDDKYNQIIASNASANIYTAGLLGSNYIAIIPGYADDPDAKPQYLKNGSHLQNTQPAIILENLIGQLMFNLKNKS